MQGSYITRPCLRRKRPEKEEAVDRGAIRSAERELSLSRARASRRGERSCTFESNARRYAARRDARTDTERRKVEVRSWKRQPAVCANDPGWERRGREARKRARRQGRRSESPINQVRVGRDGGGCAAVVAQGGRESRAELRGIATTRRDSVLAKGRSGAAVRAGNERNARRENTGEQRETTNGKRETRRTRMLVKRFAPIPFHESSGKIGPLESVPTRRFRPRRPCDAESNSKSFRGNAGIDGPIATDARPGKGEERKRGADPLRRGTREKRTNRRGRVGAGRGGGRVGTVDVEEASEGPQMESVQFGILENVGSREKSKRSGAAGRGAARQSASRALFMTRT